MGHLEFSWEPGRSGVGAFGLPGIDWIAVEAVFAVFLLLLLAAFFLFFAFLAAIAHGKKILAEISVREWRSVVDGFLADMLKRGRGGRHLME